MGGNEAFHLNKERILSLCKPTSDSSQRRSELNWNLLMMLRNIPFNEMDSEAGTELKSVM